MKTAFSGPALWLVLAFPLAVGAQAPAIGASVPSPAAIARVPSDAAFSNYQRFQDQRIASWVQSNLDVAKAAASESSTGSAHEAHLPAPASAVAEKSQAPNPKADPGEAFKPSPASHGGHQH